jgi:hypothetical protein
MHWWRKKKPGFALEESVYGRIDDVFFPGCRVAMIDEDSKLGRVTVHFSTADYEAFLRVVVDPDLIDLFIPHLDEQTEVGLTVASSGVVEIT